MELMIPSPNPLLSSEEPILDKTSRGRHDLARWTFLFVPIRLVVRMGGGTNFDRWVETFLETSI